MLPPFPAIHEVREDALPKARSIPNYNAGTTTCVKATNKGKYHFCDLLGAILVIVLLDYYDI